MRHYAGLDVSMKETSVCIVDETGAVCREMKVFSHPDDLARALKHPAWRLDRIGLEAVARCRNGCSVAWSKLACRRSASRPAMRKRS